MLKRVSLTVISVTVLLLSLRAVAQGTIQHAPDGGSQLHVQSIFIPAIPNAPFSAFVVTELTTIMPDGTRKTLWNRRLVARDSSGRVFQERRAFTPNGNVKDSTLNEIEIQDPNLHEVRTCRAATGACQTYPFHQRYTPPQQNASLAPMIKMPNGTTIENQDLGRNTVEGADCLGSRQTRTIPAGLVGNEKAEAIVKEFWYSPQLGFNLIDKRVDPLNSSIQNFTVTQLSRTEPAPKIFTVPESFHSTR